MTIMMMFSARLRTPYRHTYKFYSISVKVTYREKTAFHSYSGKELGGVLVTESYSRVAMINKRFSISYEDTLL